MTSATAELKRKLKYGPRMSRQMRSEFLTTATGGAPRRLSDGTRAKLRQELARLATSADPRVRRFIRTMAERYPGVCDETRL